MYGSPVPAKPDLTGWKLVSDQAFYRGFAVGVSLMMAASACAFFLYIMEAA